jgi:Zn-dependent peptidase ImmA (M78 family)/transcriptional regulator with XRE-family HTH domain
VPKKSQTEGVRIPVNPVMLRWARETAGLSYSDVARVLKRKSVKDNTVEAWERGVDSPSYSLLERLAYTVYKRPLAVFFFPEPPVELSAKESFRTLPAIEIQKLAPRVYHLVRSALAMQINLVELCEEVNPSVSPILRNLNFRAADSIIEMVKESRRQLGITLETQSSWRDTDEALKNWRTAFEEAGIYVFKDAFHLPQLSGFCLYDSEFPIIYVNNSTPASRQIFTLFHELGHLLFGTGGVDTRLEDYVRFLKGDAKLIEVKCNAFAEEFLVPESHFGLASRGLEATEPNIESLANRYHVSREVILRRFLELGRISKSEYSRFADKWKASLTKKKGGGYYYNNQQAYLGRRYLELAFSRYYQGKISFGQLADYLGVKAKSVPGMEAIVLKAGVRQSDIRV